MRLPCPAKPIRQRFDAAVIEALLAVAWWNWEIDKITRNLEKIVSADIEALIQWGACHPFQEKNKTSMRRRLPLRAEYRPMTPEEKIALDQHVQAIAKILYADADKSQMTNLGKIEAGIRAQLQSHVSPKLGVFLSQKLQAQMPDTSAP